MSTVQSTRCDKCERFFEHSAGTGHASVLDHGDVPADEANDGDETKLDLCAKCYARLIAWFGLNATPEAPERR